LLALTQVHILAVVPDLDVVVESIVRVQFKDEAGGESGGSLAVEG